VNAAGGGAGDGLERFGGVARAGANAEGALVMAADGRKFLEALGHAVA
jgi:hypothetical protein